MDLFAERLSNFVKQLGWTQEELGFRSGVTSASINKYLLSKREPTLEIIDRISKAIGVPSRVFFEDSTFPIMRYVPTPQDAIKVLQKALFDSVTLSEWKPEAIARIALIKEPDDQDRVMACVEAILKTSDPKSKKAIRYADLNVNDAISKAVVGKQEFKQ